MMQPGDKSGFVGVGPKDPEICLVPVELIAMGERSRPVDPGWAKALGYEMLSEGQREPITLRRISGSDQFMLVIGAHRLAAAQSFAGLSPIKAIIVDADMVARGIERIANDLQRRAIPPLDCAALLADMVALLRIGDDADRNSAGRGRGDARIATLAGLTGFSGPEVENYLTLHRRLAARVGEMLRGHAIARDIAAIEALGRLDDGAQEKVAYLLLGGAATVSQALAELRKQVVLPRASRPVMDFAEAFERMSLRDKKHALAQLARLLPDGILITGID